MTKLSSLHIVKRKEENNDKNQNAKTIDVRGQILNKKKGG